MVVDINVWLDVLLARQDFLAESAQILDLGARNKAELLIPAHTLPTIAYVIGRNLKGVSAGKKAETIESIITRCLSLSTLMPCNKQIVESALRLKMNDFEDALVLASAENFAADYIITRNTKDFIADYVPALTPRDFLMRK